MQQFHRTVLSPVVSSSSSCEQCGDFLQQFTSLQTPVEQKLVSSKTEFVFVQEVRMNVHLQFGWPVKLQLFCCFQHIFTVKTQRKSLHFISITTIYLYDSHTHTVVIMAHQIASSMAATLSRARACQRTFNSTVACLQVVNQDSNGLQSATGNSTAFSTSCPQRISPSFRSSTFASTAMYSPPAFASCGYTRSLSSQSEGEWLDEE